MIWLIRIWFFWEGLSVEGKKDEIEYHLSDILIELAIEIIAIVLLIF